MNWSDTATPGEAREQWHRGAAGRDAARLAEGPDDGAETYDGPWREQVEPVEPTLEEEFAGRMDAAGRAARLEDEISRRRQERGDWMQTYTGGAFYPMDPRAEDVHPLDIAHGLSMICRFGGHVSSWYSVAEHAVLVSQVVPPEDALWGLLHDGGEAYVGDMVRPLKYQLPDYRRAEHRISAAIAERFGLPTECPPSVKAADNRILRDERDALMPGPPPLPWVSIENVEPLGVPIVGYSPAEAKKLFLHRWAELTNGAFHASGRMPEPYDIAGMVWGNS